MQCASKTKMQHLRLSIFSTPIQQKIQEAVRSPKQLDWTKTTIHSRLFIYNITKQLCRPTTVDFFLYTHGAQNNPISKNQVLKKLLNSNYVKSKIESLLLVVTVPLTCSQPTSCIFCSDCIRPCTANKTRYMQSQLRSCCQPKFTSYRSKHAILF